MAKISFSESGWNDYLYWQTEDKKTLKRIDAVNRLVYRISGDGVEVVSCRYHYDNK